MSQLYQLDFYKIPHNQQYQKRVILIPDFVEPVLQTQQESWVLRKCCVFPEVPVNLLWGLSSNLAHSQPWWKLTALL